MADADAKYRDGGKNWKADGAEVKAIAKWVRDQKPEDVPAAIALYKFPSARGAGGQLAGGGKAAIAASAWQPQPNSSLAKKQIEKTLLGPFGSGECQLRGRGGEIVIDHEAGAPFCRPSKSATSASNYAGTNGQGTLALSGVDPSMKPWATLSSPLRFRWARRRLAFVHCRVHAAVQWADFAGRTTGPRPRGA